MVRSKHLVIGLLALFLFGLCVFVYLFGYSGPVSGALGDKVSYVEGKDGVSVVEEGQGRDTSIREALLAKLRGKNSEPEEKVEEEVMEDTKGSTGENEESTEVVEEGIPLGDGYIAKSPQSGYIYACESMFNGAGASGDVPWIEGDVWYENKKSVVDGAATWANSVSFTIEEDKRVVVSNGLPNHLTGAFPISPNDDAYTYDRNPNLIQEQDVLLELSLLPMKATQPTCISLGMVGIGLNGVALFNGLDAAGRDAVAHEVQDTCSGHPERSGEYHYHGESDCLVDTIYEGANSTLLGYALDGFGIFSSVENGVKLTNTDLDACHGHEHIIPWNGELKSFYHYHMTDEYPYTLGCFTGTPTKVQPEVLTNQEVMGTQQNKLPTPQGENTPPLPQSSS